MDVSSFNEYDKHNKVVVIDKKNGLNAVIALHRNGVYQHAFGATRIWSYRDKNEAIRDALKLSKIMSYKCALANLQYAGAKGVIITTNLQSPKNRLLLESYLKEVNKLKGAFITGADVGVSASDVRWMKQKSEYIVGVKTDPVKYTALGVFYGIEVALKEIFGSEDVANKKFAIQGLGKIGSSLLHLLYEKGAIIYATDVNDEQIAYTLLKYPKVKIVKPSEIHTLKVNVFSPCALSNVINSKSIEEIRSDIVLGGANSQLENENSGIELHKRNILYGPDYVVNAGGIIAVVDEYEHESVSNSRIKQKVENIKITLKHVISESKKTNEAINLVTDKIAKKIID